MDEPSLAPEYLLGALRAFLATATAGEPAEAAAPSSGQAAAPGEAPPGWEESGCTVWDAAALPDDAAFLVQHGTLDMLPPLLRAAAAADKWRALEIGVGTLGNLACHAGPKQQLLRQAGLPELLLDGLLWVDDAASLAELCRCLDSLLADSDRQAADAWWAALMREETLGRLAWVLENTLSSALLERVINLLSTLLAAAQAAHASSSGGGGGGAEQELVPRLLSLDLLPLLASVLHGWVVRLRAEQQLFGGGGGGGADSGSHASSAKQPALRRKADAEADSAAAGAGATAGGDAAAAALVPPPPGSPADWEEKVVAAAEVTEEAAMAALGLLEALVADPAGEAATNASAATKEALLRLIAESPNRGMRALATPLLAGLEGVGPLLLQHPPAVRAVLGRLEAGAGAKRARAADGAAAGPHGHSEQEEEVEAAWALCSALARALSGAGAAAGAPAAPAAEGSGGAAAVGAAARGEADAALAALAEHVDALSCSEWAACGPAVVQHQAYVLGRVAPLLGGAAGERLAAAAAAAERE